MPIYEYRCGACGFQKEYLQRITDARLTDCPECGKPALTKMVTAAGFQLKGSGWYVTDFKNNGAKPSASKPGGTKSSEPESNDTKANDTKSSDTKSGDAKASVSKSDDAPKKADSKTGAVSGTGASPAAN